MNVVIVGGGIVGLCCAYQLRRSGCHVTVLESGRCGDGASRGNAGWITPFLSAPRAQPGAAATVLQGMLKSDTPAKVHPRLERSFANWLWRFWKSSTKEAFEQGTRAVLRLSNDAVAAYQRLIAGGVPLEIHHDGLLVVTLSAPALQHFVKQHALLERLGYRGRAVLLEKDQLRRFEPALSDDVFGGLHLPAESHVRPESVTGALVQWLRDSGATVVEGCNVTAVLSRSNGSWEVRAGELSESLTATHVVLSAGVATKHLLAPLGASLPLEPAKGTSVTMKVRGPVPSHPLKLAEAMVACSPFSNAWRVSGTFDLGNGDMKVDPKRLDSVVRSARRYLRVVTPANGDLQWAGLRPVTPDDLPIIGRVPEYGGLYVATGYGTLGMTLGPVTSELIAQLICEDRLPDALIPFHLERFGLAAASQSAAGI